MLLRLVSYTPLAVPLILALVEDKVSTAPDDVQDVLSVGERKAAAAMLLYLDILAKRGERDAVAEEDVERIYAILRRLWEESQTLSAPVIGPALQVTARVLHSMRPQRFPVVKFSYSSSNGNRLLNYHEFGLHENDVAS